MLRLHTAVRLILFSSALLMAGCQQPNDGGTRELVAQDHLKLVELEAKVRDQAEEIERLDNSISLVRRVAVEASDAGEALRKTFNGNVDQHNEELRRERTRLGVCGQEQVWATDGTYTIRNKDCPAPRR